MSAPQSLSATKIAMISAGSVGLGFSTMVWMVPGGSNQVPIGTFGPGGTWFEPPGTIHTMVENPSPTESAEIMAIFVADSDCGALTIFDD